MVADILLNVFLAIAVDNLADAQSLSDADNEADELNNVRAPSPTEHVRHHSHRHTSIMIKCGKYEKRKSYFRVNVIRAP